MCVEILNVNSCSCAAMDYNKKHSSNIKKMSYSMRKVLKTILKKLKSDRKKVSHQVYTQCSMESLESLENNRNAKSEIESENKANERIDATSSCGSSISSEEYNEEAATYVPVNFVRTGNGTFFWTTTSSIPADANLIEPLCCSTDNQIAVPQFRARWAQA